MASTATASTVQRHVWAAPQPRKMTDPSSVRLMSASSWHRALACWICVGRQEVHSRTAPTQRAMTAGATFARGGPGVR